jgi:cobalt/nickel transport system permease protein
VALLVFVVAVVATPREALWAYGAYATMLFLVASVARVPLQFVARRATLEAPVVAFALFLPFLGEGATVDVAGIALSRAGLWAAWNVLAKATLGLTASLILAATTPVAEILHGLEHLRAPRALTSIAGFMIRYADVISGEMKRMRVARLARAYEPRWFWQARPLAASASALLIRSYERGERVYLAMVSRGFTGALPVAHEAVTSPVQWAAALAPSAAAVAVAVLASVAMR